MPTIPEIKISIENKDLFVKDEFVRKGNFQHSSNGNLIMFTGGFTAVFPVVVQNEKWAFRCWHANMGNTAQRLKEIAQCVKSSQVPYLCDFAYVDKGILVEGNLYPTTRMRWVEGQTIKEYICDNSYSKEKLHNLADRFLALIKDMHNRGFAHGDLQHGNIMVDKNESLFLVDYDSFYCPALKGEKDIIKGLPDYQHPARNKNLFANEKLDWFSELIIYTSIFAIAENPGLVAKYQLANSEKMLFSKNDFNDINSSIIYKDLKSMNNSRVSKLLEILSYYLSKKSIDELAPFYNLLNDSELIKTTGAAKTTGGTKKNGTSDAVNEPANKYVYCPFCGKKYYKPISKYCHHCGRKRL